MTWREFYMSDVQGLYLLWVVPVAFLVYLLLSRRPEAGDADGLFVWRYALFFSAETLLDAFVPGAMLRWLGLADAPVATAVLVFFVLLGDFRVLWLSFRLGGVDQAMSRAVAWTLVTPNVAFATSYALERIVAGLPSQTIWLLYELCFAAVIAFVRSRVLPKSRFLSGVLTYVLAYYLLWATADVLILVFALDSGWALRVIPNQLYYSFYVPFVYLFFRRVRRND